MANPQGVSAVPLVRRCTVQNMEKPIKSRGSTTESLKRKVELPKARPSYMGEILGAIAGNKDFEFISEEKSSNDRSRMNL